MLFPLCTRTCVLHVYKYSDRKIDLLWKQLSLREWVYWRMCVCVRNYTDRKAWRQACRKDTHIFIIYWSDRAIILSKRKEIWINPPIACLIIGLILAYKLSDVWRIPLHSSDCCSYLNTPTHRLLVLQADFRNCFSKGESSTT